MLIFSPLCTNYFYHRVPIIPAERSNEHSLHWLHRETWLGIAEEWGTASVDHPKIKQLRKCPLSKMWTLNIRELPSQCWFPTETCNIYMETEKEKRWQVLLRNQSWSLKWKESSLHSGSGGKGEKQLFVLVWSEGRKEIQLLLLEKDFLQRGSWAKLSDVSIHISQKAGVSEPAEQSRFNKAV